MKKWKLALKAKVFFDGGSSDTKTNIRTTIMNTEGSLDLSHPRALFAMRRLKQMLEETIKRREKENA